MDSDAVKSIYRQSVGVAQITIKGGGSKMIIDYTIAKECSNPEVFYTCYQCGKCGRVFEDGIMIDDGGTTIDEEE